MSDYRFEEPDTELMLVLSAVEAEAIAELARSVRIVLDAPLPPDRKSTRLNSSH